MFNVFFIFFSLTSLLFFSKFSISLDTLALNQILSDNGQTLVSAAHKFELGFFGPWESSYRYVGIWFKNIPGKTLVWVANNDNPLKDSSGVLSITPAGNIVILSNRTKSIIWTNNGTSMGFDTTDPVLQLLDTGNLVVKFNNTSDYLWQSFDYPGNTLLPGMKLGWDLKKNQEWYLTSWKSEEDPSKGTGTYTYHVDYRGLPQMILLQGSEVQYRSGPWDGVRFGGGQPKPNTVFNPIFVLDESNVYYTYDNVDESIVSRFMVSPSGLLQQLKWSITRAEWIVIATIQTDTCDGYDTCGSYGICSVTNSQECWCPDGFTPRLPRDWYRLDWAGGCVRKTPLNCSTEAGFRKFSKVKLPDTSYFMVNKTTTESDCEQACLKNCSCTAYAKTQVSGCVIWFGELLDIRTYDEGGQDLYLRMPASELAQDGYKKRKLLIGVITVVAAVGVLLLCLICCCIFRKRISKPTAVVKKDFEIHHELSIGDEDIDLPSFDLITISTATNGFSFTNKIGEGGFGPVYKGVLSTGQEIAVKRLSKSSGQGLEEFKNEVILIARLQHRNLVRLLGCCIHGEERMLVYEYMQNRSLDLIIFDETKGRILDWRKRFQIIVGIARGLLYLHRDSRLRIIHRDMKTSNILLDGEMNPKISDFGLARTFGGDENHDNTNRVMGTFGYMAPEYAIDGIFSVKSDVFSFGVLTLEIVSGKKNRGFCHPDHDLNLLGHVWRLFNEGEAMTLVNNPCIGCSPPVSEVLRCIHVALLCVQKRSEDRPTMSSVLLMLDSENPVLPPPTLPGFYAERSVVESDSPSTRRKPLGSNEMTVTLLLGR